MSSEGGRRGDLRRVSAPRGAIAPSAAAASREAGLVLENLERIGLLLLIDRTLPSLASLVAGEPIRSSWWSHPKGGAIYRISTELSESRDVAVTKLLSEKITFVHRRLFPELLAIGSGQRPWQLAGLGPEARRLLEAVRELHEVRTDAPPERKALPAGKALSEAAADLSKRLLVHGTSVHTERGHHATRLETWDTWAKRVSAEPIRSSVDQSMRVFEEIADGLGTLYGTTPTLPWRTSRARSASRRVHIPTRS